MIYHVRAWPQKMKARRFVRSFRCPFQPVILVRCGSAEFLVSFRVTLETGAVETYWTTKINFESAPR